MKFKKFEKNTLKNSYCWKHPNVALFLMGPIAILSSETKTYIVTTNT